MNSVEINSDMPDPLWWLRRPRHKNADLVSNPNTFVMRVCGIRAKVPWTYLRDGLAM